LAGFQGMELKLSAYSIDVQSLTSSVHLQKQRLFFGFGTLNDARIFIFHAVDRTHVSASSAAYLSVHQLTPTLDMQRAE